MTDKSGKIRERLHPSGGTELMLLCAVGSVTGADDTIDFSNRVEGGLIVRGRTSGNTTITFLDKEQERALFIWLSKKIHKG